MNYGCSIKIASPDGGRRASSGFTLLEALVASTLSLLLLILAYQFFLPSLKISHSVTLRAQTQEQAILALRGLVKELETTNTFGLSLSADSRTVAVHPIVDVSQNSQRIYADDVTVYTFDPEELQLTRHLWREGTAPSQDTPYKFSEAGLNALADSLTSPGRVVVEQVADFEIRHSGAGNQFRLPIVVRIRMLDPSGSGSRNFELVRTVSPRNRL